MALKKSRLPTDKDLPDSDGRPVERKRHAIQAWDYLIGPLERFLREQGIQAYVSGNSCIYYALDEPAIGPDVFVINGGIDRDQLSWVAWQEGNRLPNLIIELLSRKTQKQDRGSKMEIYRDTFRTPEYYLFDDRKMRLEGYHLHDGKYLPVTALPDGRLPCVTLPLTLGVRSGWLRWITTDGELLPTGDELARRAREAENKVTALEAEIRRLRGEP